MLQLKKKRGEGALVGLEIEAGSIAATEIRGNGRPELAASAIAPLPVGAFHEGEVVDSEAVAETLRAMFAANDLPKRVRLGIANQRVVVRTLRLPEIDDPRQLEAALRFQAEELIPMPIDQAILDHRVVGGTAASEDAAAQIDVVLVAARRDMIAASLQPVREAGLEPVGVDLSAFGLIRALSNGRGDEPNPADGLGQTAIIYCNFGDVTNLAVAKGRSCLFTRVAPAGLEGISTELAGSTGLIPDHVRLWLTHVGLLAPVESIEGDPAVIAHVRAALENGASALLDELRLSLDFYGAQEGSIPVERVVLTGYGSVIPGLVDHMVPILGLPIEVGLPAALAWLDQATAARLTPSYGLALEE